MLVIAPSGPSAIPNGLETINTVPCWAGGKEAVVWDSPYKGKGTFMGALTDKYCIVWVGETPC